VDHDLVDEAPEEGLLVLRRELVPVPQVGDLLPGLEKGLPILGAHRLGSGGR
jgi:hypothetical protein